MWSLHASLLISELFFAQPGLAESADLISEGSFGLDRVMTPGSPLCTSGENEVEP